MKLGRLRSALLAIASEAAHCAKSFAAAAFSRPNNVQLRSF
jgi:hypothetical protein